MDFDFLRALRSLSTDKQVVGTDGEVYHQESPAHAPRFRRYPPRISDLRAGLGQWWPQLRPRRRP
jgi:hypothetical protein